MDGIRSEASVPPASSENSVTVETPVDFVALHQVNPDIYAWINIPDTVIDYPVLCRDDDNSYYLTHTANGEKRSYGSIFSETYNKKDFSEFNTVLYGHNMKNGTMFGTLKKFRDLTYFNSHEYINIYQPGRIMKYRIFAAYTRDNKHLLFHYNFNDLVVCRRYLEEIASIHSMSAHINADIPVKETDRILTLSTCTSSPSERFLVQGVLVYDSKTQPATEAGS